MGGGGACDHGVAFFNNKVGVEGVGCTWVSGPFKFNNNVGVDGGVAGMGGGEGGPWKHGEVCIISRWGLVDSWVLRRGRVDGRES